MESSDEQMDSVRAPAMARTMATLDFINEVLKDMHNVIRQPESISLIVTVMFHRFEHNQDEWQSLSDADKNMIYVFTKIMLQLSGPQELDVSCSRAVFSASQVAELDDLVTSSQENKMWITFCKGYFTLEAFKRLGQNEKYATVPQKVRARLTVVLQLQHMLPGIPFIAAFKFASWNLLLAKDTNQAEMLKNIEIASQALQSFRCTNTFLIEMAETLANCTPRLTYFAMSQNQSLLALMPLPVLAAYTSVFVSKVASVDHRRFQYIDPLSSQRLVWKCLKKSASPRNTLLFLLDNIEQPSQFISLCCSLFQLYQRCETSHRKYATVIFNTVLEAIGDRLRCLGNNNHPVAKEMEELLLITLLNWLPTTQKWDALLRLVELNCTHSPQPKLQLLSNLLMVAEVTVPTSCDTLRMPENLDFYMKNSSSGIEYADLDSYLDRLHELNEERLHLVPEPELKYCSKATNLDNALISLVCTRGRPIKSSYPPPPFTQWTPSDELDTLVDIAPVNSNAKPLVDINWVRKVSLRNLACREKSGAVKSPDSMKRPAAQPPTDDMRGNKRQRLDSKKYDGGNHMLEVDQNFFEDRRADQEDEPMYFEPAPQILPPLPAMPLPVQIQPAPLLVLPVNVPPAVLQLQMPAQLLPAHAPAPLLQVQVPAQLLPANVPAPAPQSSRRTTTIKGPALSKRPKRYAAKKAAAFITYILKGDKPNMANKAALAEILATVEPVPVQVPVVLNNAGRPMRAAAAVASQRLNTSRTPRRR